MRRYFSSTCLVLLLLLVLCAAGARAQRTIESSGTPFSISSVNSPFAMAGTFDGEYRVLDDSIEVTITSVSIHLRDYGSYHGRRKLSFINVGLATAREPRGWKVISRARALPVGEIMRPGDQYLTRQKMRFHLPREGSPDLTKCWLLVEMGELSLDSNDEDKAGWAFAHSARDIFSPLLLPLAQTERNRLILA